ncbi:2-oxo-4-hydroxy-4-carboxy-5-ureidoimidazoline decarboxylase [Microbacterium betulae]|uniref:2-oxo-4-hydroxy-4-carboxy-5-ureidoimidazoline decarboxylase n=1 Tax=Microbacterium betulae TaxID=2981139 RepID=A0AA97FGV9_9MICO|nr:2-oxo-4-hydroxy-4-carboxy-5-ureidoimidazoline decarboxylase [Microbacterium sp. AB]WOF22765.1 2-oxo-4-hydroxy-4-carboxy-5-ureidoimidazoline decarboxylase [Microbacterium sp. AB]
MLLEDFNGAPGDEAAAVVTVWADVPAWADALVAARPYASVDALVDRAAAEASSWGGPELDTALAQHPRIGDTPSGETAEASASRREQASMAHADADVTTRIAEGNAAYEARFGRVFLIRAAGRSPEEMLAELDRRLGNDDAAEAREACAQLAEIALLRIRATFAGDDAATAPSAPAHRAPAPTPKRA